MSDVDLKLWQVTRERINELGSDEFFKKNVLIANDQERILYMNVAMQQSLQKLALKIATSFDSLDEDKINLLLHYALTYKALDVVDMLIAKGADWQKPYEGTLPVFSAIKGGLNNIILRAIEDMSDVNVTDNEGSPLLAMACINCDRKVIRRLLELGADSTRTTPCGRDCFQLAYNGVNLNVIRELPGGEQKYQEISLQVEDSLNYSQAQSEVHRSLQECMNLPLISHEPFWQTLGLIKSIETFFKNHNNEEGDYFVNDLVKYSIFCREFKLPNGLYPLKAIKEKLLEKGGLNPWHEQVLKNWQKPGIFSLFKVERWHSTIGALRLTDVFNPESEPYIVWGIGRPVLEDVHEGAYLLTMLFPAKKDFYCWGNVSSYFSEPDVMARSLKKVLCKAQDLLNLKANSSTREKKKAKFKKTKLQVSFKMKVEAYAGACIKNGLTTQDDLFEDWDERRKTWDEKGSF